MKTRHAAAVALVLPTLLITACRETSRPPSSEAIDEAATVLAATLGKPNNMFAVTSIEVDDNPPHITVFLVTHTAVEQDGFAAARAAIDRDERLDGVAQAITLAPGTVVYDAQNVPE